MCARCSCAPVVYVPPAFACVVVGLARSRVLWCLAGAIFLLVVAWQPAGGGTCAGRCPTGWLACLALLSRSGGPASWWSVTGLFGASDSETHNRGDCPLPTDRSPNTPPTYGPRGSSASKLQARQGPGPPKTPGPRLCTSGIYRLGNKPPVAYSTVSPAAELPLFSLYFSICP